MAPPTTNSALVQRNLNLLANGNDSAELLLICGSKHWNVHKLIVESASEKFYEKLVADADHRDRVYWKEHSENMDKVMKFVYTLSYSIIPVAPHYTCQKKAKLAKSILANGLAHRYSIKQLHEDSKAAFIAMKPSLLFKHATAARRPNWEDATDGSRSDSWKRFSAVIRAGELIMSWRANLDPCFETWFCWWLNNCVTLICDFEDKCMDFCKLLDGKLNPLAKKANLRRLKNGRWQGSVV